MTTHHSDRRRLFWVRLVGIVGLILLSTMNPWGPSLKAEELADQVQSLRMVPADAAFYTASLRLSEQWDIFRASNTYDRLLEVPIIQMAKMQVLYQWESNPDATLARIRDYFRSDEGAQSLALIGQMFSEEVFLYGDEDTAIVIELLNELNSINRAAGLEAATTGREQDEVVAEHVYELLDERGEDFKVPSIVWGFRIEDGDGATKHLDHLQEMFTDLLEEHQPEIAERIKREQIADHEFITLRLDGSMLPWDQLREESDNLDDEQFEKWKRLLSDKSVALAIGVVGQFVVVSLGDSTEPIEKLGKEAVLAEHSELARLDKHADQRITSVAYVSDAFVRRVNSPEQTFQDLVGLADDGLQAAQIDAEDRAALVEDLRALAEDFLKYIPEPGTYLSLNYLTLRGYEGFAYQFGKLPMLDDSEPLSILNHVGGNPLGFIASRTRQPVEEYDKTVDVIKRIAQRVETIAEEKAPAEEWAKYQEHRDEMVELLARLNRATREHLFPALQDGQQALVLDVSATSQRWIEAMPESPKPLPMLEVSLVATVSDAEHLRQGISEYFSIAEDFTKVLHEANPDEIQAVDLPEPEERSADRGTIYFYPLPDEWGVDEQLSANGAVTDEVAVLSVFPSATERVLQSIPLKIDTSIDMDRAAAQAGHFQFAKLIDAVRPWVDYGFDVAMGRLTVDEEEEDAEDDESDDDEEAQDVESEDDQADESDESEEGEPDATDQEQAAAMMKLGFVLPQIHQLLNVVEAIQSHTSITYREDEAWVTHSETRLKDID